MAALLDVLGYVALIALGLLLRATGAIGKDAMRPLTILLLWVTLPAAILRAVVSADFKTEYLGIFVLGLAANWIMIGLAGLLTRGRPRSAWQFAGLNLPGYNIGIFAMPFTAGFLSPEGFLALCLFDAGNSVMCTGGTYAFVCRDGSGQWRRELLSVAKKLLGSGPLCAYAAALALNFADASIPGPIDHFLATCAGANAFIGMIMVGLSIDLRIDFAKLRNGLSMVFWRYVVNAVLALGAWLWAPWPDDALKAVVLLLAAPLPAMGLIFTVKAKLDASLSANLNTISILVSIMLMTALLALL